MLKESNPRPAATLRRRPANRRVYIIGILCIAITIAAACMSIGLLRRDQIKQQMSDANNLAIVLAAQAARSFQAVDLVVQEAQPFLARRGSLAADFEKLEKRARN